MNSNSVIFSRDRMKMDVTMIQRYLSTTYWAEGRTLEQVQTSIDFSTPFGLFLDGQQIAFARVLSDKTVFAYLMDVFVLPEHRGKGYATQLLESILQYSEFDAVQFWTLKTKDAHALYKRTGFIPLSDPEMWMVLNKGEPSC